LTAPPVSRHDGVLAKRSLREFIDIAGIRVSAELTPYELRVLRSHRNRPLRESELERRRTALLKLSKLGYIKLRQGLYWITPAGEQVLAGLDR
jgi:hypothetical protein